MGPLMKGGLVVSHKVRTKRLINQPAYMVVSLRSPPYG
jgi:hypothetical protein